MSSVYGQTLLDEMVHSQGLPMPLVKQAAREILEIIRGGLVRDGVVNVSNFGTFRLKAVAARAGFNPQTREPITIPAHQRVIFSPCKALRELIQPIHLPPIPVETERAPRAAASNAAIAASEPVATRTIIPPPGSQDAANEPSADETAVAGNANLEAVPPPYAPPVTEQSTPSAPPTSPASSTRTEINDYNPDEGIELPLEEETLTALRQEKLQQSESSQGNRKRYFLLGAAAVLVIAIVSASLMQRDEQSSPVATVAPKVTQITPPPVSQGASTQSSTEAATVAPAVTDAPTATETMSAEAPPVLQEAAGTAEGEDRQPMEGAAPTFVTPTPATDSASATASTSEMAAEHSEPVTVAETTRPSHFFFTERQHLIANGESLWRLARRYYHDPLLWPHIYQANAAVIDDPDSLITGHNIVIPSLQGEPGKLTRTDRRNIAEGYYLTYLHYKNNGHKDAFFALLEAKRYDNKVVEEHRSLLKLSKVEEILLGQQETMPF